MATPFGSPVLQTSRSSTPRTSWIGGGSFKHQNSLPANTKINVTEWEDIRKVSATLACMLVLPCYHAACS